MVEYTKVYRYLGIHMHENLEFSETAEVLSQASGKAFGAMISKIHGFKDVGSIHTPKCSILVWFQ